MLYDEFNVSSITFDPCTSGFKKTPEIELELVPFVAKGALKNFSSSTFSAVYNSAIDHGMISEQQISQAVGKDTLRVLQSTKAQPSPAKCREILQIISSLNPEEAKGKKEPWRHAKPRTTAPASNL